MYNFKQSQQQSIRTENQTVHANLIPFLNNLLFNAMIKRKSIII